MWVYIILMVLAALNAAEFVVDVARQAVGWSTYGHAFLAFVAALIFIMLVIKSNLRHSAPETEDSSEQS